ncbi:MAG: copper chaperone PCu(A)C, partial [Anaerolineaceae bacterium]|nr:copper chaperone PCu(A)C [Anaerolineaceae bacterium]
DQLIKVETDRAVRVEFRRGNGPDDLTSAEPLQVVDIPALSKVDFKNGQYYMILTGVKEDINPGETVALTLFFAKSGTLNIDVVAKKR